MEKRWLNFFLVVFLGYFALMYYYASFPPPKPAEGTEVVSEVGTETTLPLEGAVDAPELKAGETPDEVTEAGEATTEVAQESVRRPRRTAVENIVVNTPLVHVELTPVGGVPSKWEILPSDLVAPVVDFTTNELQKIDLIPQVGGRDERPVPFELEGNRLADFNDVLWEHEVSETDAAVTVTFLSPVLDDLQVRRVYTFPKDSYFNSLKLEIISGDARTKIGTPGEGWGLGWQGGFLQPDAQRRLGGYIYSAAAVGQDLRLKDLYVDDEPVRYENEIGWAGQEKKYFAGIIIPAPENPADAVTFMVRKRDKTADYTKKGVQDPMTVILHHTERLLEPGETLTHHYALFVGPKSEKLLKNPPVTMAAGTLGLDQLSMGKMPLGQNWIRPIALGLLGLLRWFEGFAQNWGLAIILLVLTVKIALYPLSHWAIINQAKTMAEQTRIRPMLEEINRKYKNDNQKRTQETMALFREHNINPLGALRGCFPLLIQMPIFFGLYVALDQSIEIRGQSFLWMRDLAAPDRLVPLGFTIPLLGWDALNILPFLMAITQFITTKMMSSNITDETQKQVMLLMPFMFIFMLYSMPAGLMLYWTVQNVWQIGHTYLTKRYVAAHEAKINATTPNGGTPAKAAS